MQESGPEDAAAGAQLAVRIGGLAAGGETVRSAAEKCADDEGQGGGVKKSRYFPRVRAAEAAANGALCGLPAGGRGRRAREDPRTGVRSSGCGRRQEGAKKAPESGAVVAVSGCMV